MFKALLIDGASYSINQVQWNYWIDALYELIKEKKAYRISKSGTPKKKVITIVDAYVDDMAYKWLTPLGIGEYCIFLKARSDFGKWVDWTRMTWGIATESMRKVELGVIEELLKDLLLKSRLADYDDFVKKGYDDEQTVRIKQLVQSLTVQASDIGLDLMYFINKKFDLFYILGDMYKVSYDRTEATLEDPKDWFAKDFVDI